jgi:hypothetical protein
VIAFPQMVMVYKADQPKIDPSKIEIQIPDIDMGAPPAGDEAPGPGAPAEGSAPQSSDPLERMIDQQDDEAEKANQSLEDALKAK